MNLVVYFNALPCTPVLTLSPPCTLYIISQCLRLDVSSKDLICILSTGYTGHIEMVYPKCVFGDGPELANLLEFQHKQNAFSA